MSLEQAIQENTETIKLLIAALGNANLASVAVAAPEKAAPASKGGAKGAASNKNGKEPEAAAASAPSLTHTEVRAVAEQLMAKISNHGPLTDEAKSTVTGIVAKHGAAKLADLTVDKLPAVKAELDALLNAPAAATAASTAGSFEI